MGLRVCLDTNVWLSGLLFGGLPAEIVDLALRKRFHLVISTFILDELEGTLCRKFSITSKAARALCYRIAQVADICEPPGILRVIKGKEADNLVLETALAGEARYLVTGDRKHLLPLRACGHTRIITPSAFLHVLENPGHRNLD